MSRYPFLLVCLLGLMGQALAVRAQVVTAGSDSVVVARGDVARPLKTTGLSHPAKAALWALVPGGGQIYNHDYWKLPLVYGALGGMAYLVIHNHSRFREFQRGYLARTDGDSTTVDTGPRSRLLVRDETVLRYRDFYRRNRDLSIIFSAVVYGLTITEALVDAHLSTFNVSDDLSLRVVPAGEVAGRIAPGATLVLTLR